MWTALRALGLLLACVLNACGGSSADTAWTTLDPLLDGSAVEPDAAADRGPDAPAVVDGAPLEAAAVDSDGASSDGGDPWASPADCANMFSAKPCAAVEVCRDANGNCGTCDEPGGSWFVESGCSPPASPAPCLTFQPHQLEPCAWQTYKWQACTYGDASPVVCVCAPTASKGTAWVCNPL